MNPYKYELYWNVQTLTCIVRGLDFLGLSPQFADHSLCRQNYTKN